MHILIVDDVQVDREAMVDLVYQAFAGAVTTCEASSLNAVAVAVEAQDFDAVLLDLNLPDARDLDAVRFMRHTVPHLPVIVMTGTIDEELGLSAISNGAQDFLAKAHLLANRSGLEPVLLRRAVRHAIERHRLRHESRYDVLTGVLNRRGLMEALGREVDRASRAGHTLCGLLVDCDDFKRINDTYGYDAGDTVLRMVARCAQAMTRPSDVVARHGGDEFLVLLPDIDLVRAEQAAQRLRQVIAYDGAEWGATVSIGVTVIDPKQAMIEGVVVGAETGLRRAKRAGKNQVVTVLKHD